MTVHREKRRVPWSADDMFALVADIERYPEFLPWCSALRVLDRPAADAGKEVVLAEMEISFKVHRERFKTQVTLDRAARTIAIAYIDGPFRYLKNDWRFTDDPGGGSTVDFFIDFEFKSRALQMLIGFVFNEAVRRMIGAFETRARALYGASARAPSAT